MELHDCDLTQNIDIVAPNLESFQIVFRKNRILFYPEINIGGCTFIIYIYIDYNILASCHQQFKKTCPGLEELKFTSITFDIDKPIKLCFKSELDSCQMPRDAPVEIEVPNLA